LKTELAAFGLELKDIIKITLTLMSTFADDRLEGKVKLNELNADSVDDDIIGYTDVRLAGTAPPARESADGGLARATR